MMTQMNGESGLKTDSNVCLHQINVFFIQINCLFLIQVFDGSHTNGEPQMKRIKAEGKQHLIFCL